ncbi:MAG: CoA-binding protein [Candidatus Moranbacteria bacterium]|nr:CoA-binding protein [Candidatus Moranbacteria bacterium]
MKKKMIVAVLGASDKPARYSNKAVRELVAHGYDVIPIHPSLSAVEGIPVVRGMNGIDGEVDALSVYVRPDISGNLADEIIRLAPKTAIFNPGTENPDLEGRLSEAGIRVAHACTVTTLRTGTFASLIR